MKAMNTSARTLIDALPAATRARALREVAEDLVGEALATDNPEARRELGHEALAAVAAMQRAEREAQA
jgi:chorismate-pyruvate lyase